MPVPDPVPPLAPLQKRFVRIMRWAAALSVTIAALAILLVARGDSEMHAHMLIATALGVGLSVLLCTALMTLFLNNHSGHHQDAAHHHDKDPQ